MFGNKARVQSAIFIVGLLVAAARGYAQLPAVTIDQIQEDSGIVTVGYTASHPLGGTLVTTNWDYSTDEGLTWFPIDGASIGDNDPKPSGTSTISWDTTVGPNPLVTANLTTLLFRMQVYDPDDAGGWDTKAPMPTPRYAFATAVIDGNLYAIGGRNAADLASVDVYQPAADTWQAVTPMTTARCCLGAAVIEGSLFALGGFNDADNTLSVVEVYQPTTDTWQNSVPMLNARQEFGVAAVDGQIYAIGGWGADGNPLSTVEVYQPELGAWQTVSPMPTARGALVAVAVSGKIYAIGGTVGDRIPLSLVEEYDPVSDTWREVASMPTARWGLAATVVDRKVYAIGGSTGVNTVSAVEAYDPSTNTWRSASTSSFPAQDRSAAAIDGKIYILGGVDDNSIRHATVEEFTPSPHSQSAVMQFPAEGELTDGLVSHWPAEGDANDAIGNNHGILQEGANFAPGQIGQAFHFDGTDDYLSVSSPSFIDDAAGTVSLWWKTDDLTGSQNVLGASGTDGTDILSSTFKGDWNNELQVALTVSGGLSLDLQTPPDTINDTDFHHIVITSDGLTIRLYVDSIEQPLTASTGSNTGQWFASATNAEIFTLGGLKFATPSFLEGAVDEVRVYNRALTAQEVRDLLELNNTRRVTLSPAALDTSVDTPVTIEVLAENLPSVAGFEIQLAFDSDILNFTGADAGPFLTQTGRDVFTLGPQLEQSSTPATLTYGMVSYGAQALPAGSDLLVRFSFTAINGGTTALDLTQVKLLDSNRQNISVSTTGSVITVQREMRLAFNEGSGQSVKDTRNQTVGRLGRSRKTDENDPTWMPDGLGATPCLFFNPPADGTIDYVKITDTAALNADKAFTVSMFVNLFPGSTTGEQRAFYISGAGGDALRLSIRRGRLYAIVRVGGIQKAVRSALFPTEQWQHIAMTFDGTTLTLYQQGQPLGSRSFEAPQSPAQMRRGFIGHSFYGLIDDVTILPNAVWSTADVAAEYQRGVPLIPPGAPALVQEAVGVTPSATVLKQNYPNPFNPETWIPYQLAQASPVVIHIHDTQGQVVRVLDLGLKPAGDYSSQSQAAYWNGTNVRGESVSSGVYFYTLTAGHFSQTRKFLIVK